MSLQTLTKIENTARKTSYISMIIMIGLMLLMGFIGTQNVENGLIIATIIVLFTAFITSAAAVEAESVIETKKEK